MNDNRYYGIYRGIVKDNSGEKGKVKIYVPSIYPSEFENIPINLPWAEPAQSLFGGNFTSTGEVLNKETGICGWPKVGANVWLFFEQGDHNYPIYFASTQGGEGWISEHNKQWTIHTDNVKVRVDEDPSNSKSTSKFDSYNSNCTYLTNQEKQIPTTLDIEVKGNVNIKITGSVNLQINGNVYEEINGNINRTIVGNVFEKHIGDKHIVHEGSSILEQTGDIRQKQTGDYLLTRTGDETRFINGSKNETISNVDSLTVGKQYTEMINNKSSKIIGQNDTTTIGNKIEYVEGNNTETTTLNKSETVNLNHSYNIKGISTSNITGAVNIVSNSIYILKAPQIRLN
jgi:hypothetical protein